MFAIVILGVTGGNTTELGTIGLGNQLGSFIFVLGNSFALFAMFTSFLVIALAFKETLYYDFKVDKVMLLCQFLDDLNDYYCGFRLIDNDYLKQKANNSLHDETN